MALEERSLTAQKAETVRELVSEGFRLDLLLKTAKLARSTYYYQLKRFNRANKDKKVKEMIQTIYDDHKGNYGYRRMGLAARTRCKRKYSSYKGEIGKKADNLIQRQFEGAKPYEKCYTDVTEFALPNIREKLYLSPVLDGYNSEIIEFTLSRSPDLKQVQTMLKRAFPDDSYQGTILHSDQGW